MKPIDAQAQSFVRRRELEAKLAACAFIAPALVLKSCGWVKEELFTDWQLRKFWRNLKAGGNARSAAMDANAYDRLSESRSGIDDVMDAPEYARKLSEQAHMEDNSQGIHELLKAKADGDGKKYEATIKAMYESRPATRSTVRTATDAHAKFESLVNEGIHVVPSGIPGLDTLIGGWQRKAAQYVAARPGMGKTTFALQSARNAVAAGHKVLIFSIEMSEEALWGRMACGMLKLSYTKVISRQITETQRRAVINASAELAALYGDKLMIESGAPTTDKIWEMTAAHEPDLVVIDHLMLIADKGENETLRLGKISWALKSMAKALNVAVLCALQLNRGLEGRDNKRPQLHDIRQSGQIEENADTVLGLYRQAYYDMGTEPQPIEDLEVLLLKNRSDVSRRVLTLRYNMAEQWLYPKEDK